MIKRLIAVVLCLLMLMPSSAWATIASGGVIGKANEITSDTSLVITTTADLNAGESAIIGIGINNTSGSDGDQGEISSVVDSAGNTWTKICEYTNGQTGAGTGASGGVWYTNATATLSSGGTITITTANTVTAKTAVAHKFTRATALEIAGTCQTSASDGIDPPSIAISGLTSAHTLYVRFHMKENCDTDDFVTLTAGYTAFGFAKDCTAGGSGEFKTAGEYIIETSTGSTSNPTDSGANDAVNFMIAFRESAVTVIPTSPIFFQ